MIQIEYPFWGRIRLCDDDLIWLRPPRTVDTSTSLAPIEMVVGLDEKFQVVKNRVNEKTEDIIHATGYRLRNTGLAYDGIYF